MERKSIATLALALSCIAADAGAQTVVSANVTSDTTWSGEVVLESPIFVKDATLTILPGTIVRGQPRSAAVIIGSPVGSPGALIVTQTGRIIAEGSASNPIIMTTAAVDNVNNTTGLPPRDFIADDLDSNGYEDAWVSGGSFLDDTPTTAPLAPLNRAGTSNTALWGGLVVLGNAPTNNALKAGAAVGYGQTVIEGLTVPGFPAADAQYGGVQPHDDSGVLRYVSVRHAGDELGGGNELNGISLGGVGDGTIIENLEVYANYDDGIEWFGGTVNSKNLAVLYVGDDMFDLDEGYTGINQFLFGIMPHFNENGGAAYGCCSGDKAAEFDGDNYRPDATAFNDNVNIRLDIAQTDVDTTPWPLSNPAMYNMTLIGSTPDASPDFAPVSAAGTNRGIQFRNGFAGTVLNSIVVNTGAETGIECGSGTGAPGFNVTTAENVGNDLIRLVASTLDDGAALVACELAVVANGDLAVTNTGYVGGSANVVGVSGDVLGNEDSTFDPMGDASGKLVSSLKSSPIDPRPAGVVGVDGGVQPQSQGLDRSATYRGAFDRSAPELWTEGWTVLSISGLLE
jgi:hypothetical protein